MYDKTHNRCFKMRKVLTIFMCIFYTSFVQATYNTGLKTQQYQEQQPITHVYHHHQHHRHHQTPTSEHYHQHSAITDRDYQTSITHHYVGNDNSYHQQREGGYNQQPPQQQYATQYQQQHNQQAHQTQQPQTNIYDRGSSAQVQTTVNWQNSENSINEYYTGCPSGHTGQLPYAYDCRRFLNCWHGKGHIQTCSVGTVFNPESLECDRPDKVKCEAALGVLGINAETPSHGSLKQPSQPNYRAGRYTNTNTDANVEVLCPTGAQGLQPHPSDCTSFINCANGNMHIQQCGPGTAYSIPMKVCDFKHKVDCSGREGDDVLTANTQETQSKPPLPPPPQHEDLPHTADILCPSGITGLFPYPFDYTKFINCKNGNTAIQNCVSGTAFSISKGFCESLDDIEKSDHVVYIVSQVSYEYSQTLITCPPGTEGIHLYPFNAELYVKCIQSQMQIVPCNKAKVFSITRHTCLPMAQVLKYQRVRLLSELQTTNNYRLTDEHSSMQNMVYCPGGLTGNYPHPFDSTKYLKCVRGRLFSESCASGEAFSLSRKVCALKEELSARDHVVQVNAPHGHAWSISDMEITFGSIDGLTYLMCPPGLDGYFLNPFDCTKFITCTEGVTAVDSCLNGAVFSISSKECIPRDKVEAYDRVEYLTTTKNDFSNESADQYHHELGINCNPGTFGIYPHPQDCHKFLRCANGRIAMENCPTGQVFSLTRSYCHDENEVDRTDRSSYNRGYYTGAAATTTNTVYQTGSYKPMNTPQISLSPPPPPMAMSPPSVDLRPPLPAVSTTATTSDDVNCPPGASGRLPHPYDCTKFLMCSNGETHVQACGPGTAWNKAMEVCDFKDKVDCPQDGVTSSISTVKYNAQSQFSCPVGVEGLYQHPYDWRKYLVCSHGSVTVMDCAAGTVFSVSRRTCDREARVLNTDRCNNGVYSSEYDYSHNQNFNNQSTTQWSNVATTKTQPATTYTQVTGDRWTNMNMNRPQGSTTWQHTVNTYHQVPESRPETNPVWTGTAVHVDQHNPKHTVIYEEGSFEPNRNYNSQSFNTPLAPLQPTTSSTGSTISNVVYAQPIGSQEDSQEIFSNIPTKPIPNTYSPPQPNPNINRQDHVRNFHTWTPKRPIDIPGQGQSTVYTNTHIQIPQPGPPVYASYPGPTPTFKTDDSGQKPLTESDFKTTTINVDQLPGQIYYNLNDFDQLPSASAKHNNNDDSNLYGGLQPPQTVTTTTARHYLDPTQVPVPTPTTTPTPKHRVFGYPQLSNATIQTFPNQPHYSPPYSEVTHSRNASWAGRKIPQHVAGKPSYRDPLNSENNNNKITSTPNPQYYGISPPPYANSEHDANDYNSENPELAMKDALKILLKPYLDAKTSSDDEMAEKAQSHIMSLVTVSSTTSTTHKSPLPSNRNTLAPSTTPHYEDAELILAGEQHNLVGLTKTKTDNHETSTSYDIHQIPLQTERSLGSAHDHNIHWQKHRGTHGMLHSKIHHSREFHEQHPNLPNPFEEKTNLVSSYNPRSEATTPRTLDFDLRVDSAMCPFECGNGRCIEQHQVCDGVNNCGNRKDEAQCEHLGYEVRLTGGQSSNMGRIEVKILGNWGYVCDDKFGLHDADVLCRELGFKMGAMEVRGNSYYAPTDVNIYFAMDEVECKGNETSLKECNFKGWGVNNCGPDEVVGVVCKVPKLKCPDNYWLCSTSKECIPTAFLCDVTPDCEDGSDESAEVCNAPIKYRLGGGRGSNEGRLEVYYRAEWGTVCDDDFGLKEAQVVCNSFGLYGKAEIVKNIFGPGSGPIWLDQVSCMGNETKIDECVHWAWGENNCNHTEDLAIKCTAGPKPNPVTANNSPTTNKNRDSEFDLEFEQSELDDLGLYQGLWQRSSKAVNSQKKCGHFKSNLVDEYEHPEERVVNGSIAKRGRHPWQATIRTRGRGGISSHWCGAVIISKKLILTAAHCLAGYPKGSYFVRMGDHYANIAEASEVDSNIENWYIHEKFRDQKHMNNDIALILLKTPVRFNDYVQPVCLPEKGASLEANRMCTISGWGSIKSGTSTPSNILRSAQVPILADEVCSQKNIYANAMTEGMFCAGFLDESADACDGDSGGPLVCSDEDGETLYGIISWGQHCGYANHPGVYVRVEKYIDWIYDKINLMMQQGKL